MEISWDIIFFIIIGLVILTCYCQSTDEKFENIANADIEAIRNLNNIAAKLTAGKLTTPGNMTVTGDLGVGPTIAGSGRLHITGPELLYILNKNGVMIGKEWGGSGDLSVQGNTNVGGSIAASGNISTGGGVITLSNGWTVNTTDGQFRIYHNGDLKFAVHQGQAPAYINYGLSVGEWLGENGGTINASKIVIKQSGTDNRFNLVPETPNDAHQYGGQRLSLINKNGAANVRFYQGGWGNLADEGTESIDFFKRQDGANTDNRAYQRMIDGMWSARGDCGTGWPHAGCNIRGGQFG